MRRYAVKDSETNEYHALGGHGYDKHADKGFTPDIDRAKLHHTKCAVQHFIHEYKGSRKLCVGVISVNLSDIT